MPKAEGDPGERISDAEHAVMEALWRKNPRKSTQVRDEVLRDLDAEISRIEKKG